MRSFFFLILLSASAFAQNFKVDTVNINGKKYWVYPYKFEWQNYNDNEYRYEEEYHTNWRGKIDKFAGKLVNSNNDDYINLANKNIPPVLDSLPDGDYVMYYAFKPSVKNWKKKLHLVEQPIGAYFQMKNNLFDGKISYLSYEGVVNEEGFMKDGLKDGEWKTRNEQSYPRTLSILNYKEDVQKGKEEVYAIEMVNGKEQLKLRSESEYDEKGFVNYYKEYDEFGALHLKAECDTATYLTHNSGVSSLNSYYSFMPDSVQAHYDFYYSLKTKKERKKFERYYWDYYNYRWRVRPFEVNFAPRTVPFVVYHNNGKIAGKFSYETFEKKKDGEYDYDGVKLDKKYSLIFDTLYNEDGGVALVRKALSDSLNQKRYLFFSYDQKGKLLSRQYFVLDSNNSYQAYHSEYKTDADTMRLYRLDYSSFYKIDSSFYKTDSLLLRSVENSTYYSKSYIASKIPDLVFSEFTSLYFPAKWTFKILNNDTVFHYYLQTDLNDFSVRKYFSMDTSGVMKTRPGAVCEHHLLLGNKDEDIADSSIIYFRGKRYTGSITYSTDEKLKKFKLKSFINIEGDTMKYRDYYFLKEGNIVFYGDGYTGHRLEVKDGVITSWNSNNKYGITKAVKFKDHQVDGMVRSFEVENKKLKDKLILVKEENYVDGQKQGMEKVWYCSRCEGADYDHSVYIPLTKANQRYYLENVKHFHNNNLVDTSFRYFPDGTISWLEVYDSLGNKNGIDAEFEYGGRMMRCENFVDGLSNGHMWGINYAGDTTFSMYKIMGLNEGAYYSQFFDYRTDVKTGRVDGSFIAGAPVGKWITLGEYNTLRYEVEIDSCYGTKSYYSNVLSDFNEISGADIIGTFKIYHPNGVLYTSGKTYVDNHVIDYGYMVDTVYSSHKLGRWTYHNNVGRMTHDINYYAKEKFMYIVGKDSVFVEGDYKEYYANGNLKYEGLLFGEGTRLDCSSDIEEPEFFVQYKTYLSENGDTIVKNGNGKVTTFYANGSIWWECELEDGKLKGWYKTFNKEGILEEVGQYKNGARDGRWLKGDLTGVNYTDDQCFQNEEEKEREQEKNKNLIQLELTIYKDGEMVNSYSYYFRRTE
jgi:antitoxin component YwqK of YwqJK toxin-antitoxin module